MYRLADTVGILVKLLLLQDLKSFLLFFIKNPKALSTHYVAVCVCICLSQILNGPFRGQHTHVCKSTRVLLIELWIDACLWNRNQVGSLPAIICTREPGDYLLCIAHQERLIS